MNSNRNTKCSYCLKKLQSKFIYCIQCKLEICVKCFCYGIEGGDHRKTHKYRIESIVKKDKVCLFKNDCKWNFDEELKLMDAVIIYKTGNWVDIAAMVRTKTADECRLHFIDNYTNSSFGRSLIKYIKLHDEPASCKPIFDHTGGHCGPSLFDRLPSCLLKSDEEKLLGFISHRNEFHLEFDDDAERLIATLEPARQIDSLIAALQTTLVDIYDQRLVQRDRYKRVAREHNLISHIIAHILDKSPRDYTYFHRQMLKRLYPAYSMFSFPTPTSNQRHKSLFGRVYVRSHRSSTVARSTDSNSVEMSTPSEADNACHTPVMGAPSMLSPFSGCPPVEDHPSWHYNAFSLRDNLRPFLRYLSAATTKDLLDNLKKEEQLKSEIVTLQACVKHGILSYEDYKDKLAKHTKRMAGQSNHKDTKSAPKRKRGKSRNFGFNRMLRRKRVQKYLISLESRDS